MPPPPPPAALVHWCIGALGHWGTGALGHWVLNHIDPGRPAKQGSPARARALRRGVDLIFIFDIMLNFLLVYQENAGPEGTQHAIG